MSTLRVKNPSSSHHMTFLKPWQKLAVSVGDVACKDFASLHAELNSEFLFFESTCETPYEKVFLFSPSCDLSPREAVSTQFLGDVALEGDGYKSRVCVMMDCANAVKRDIITACNPAKNQIKIYPHQILEVVVSSPIWGTTLHWAYVAGVDNRMELLASTVITPADFDPKQSKRGVNDAFYVYPRVSGWTTIAPTFNEFHFWFRFKPVAAKVLASLPGGINPLRLLFSGRQRQDVRMEYSLDVHFNTRKPGSESPRSERVTFEDSRMDADGGKVVAGLSEIDAIEDPADRYEGMLPDDDFPLTRRQRRSQRKRLEKLNRTLYPDPLLPRRTEIYTPPTPAKFSVRKVTLVAKSDASLDYGCKTVDFADVDLAVEDSEITDAVD